eukprot:Rmarinus@m.19444
MYATGITYDYRGVTLTKKVYKMFLAWGQARMGGYKASWSKEMCRTCTMTLDWFRASRTEPSFLECRLRSFAEHDPTIEDVRTKWETVKPRPEEKHLQTAGKVCSCVRGIFIPSLFFVLSLFV